PDAFFAAEGALLTTLVVLDGFGAFPAVIEAELERELPFLATTRFLVAAVRAGMGREQAHELLKEHAVAAALERRSAPAEAVDLVGRLAADDRLPLDEPALRALVASPLEFTGDAARQVAAVVGRV